MEILAVKLDRDADFQNPVVDAALVQIGSLLHHGKRDVGGDDHRFAGQQPFVDHIKHALPAETGVPFRAQVIQNQQLRAHQHFQVGIPVRAEVALHPVHHIGQSVKQDGNHLLK